MQDKQFRVAAITVALVIGTATIAPEAAMANQWHYGDGSIVGSLCIGPLCYAGENFGRYDTLRLKSPTPVIDVVDTSTGPYDARNAWQIHFNDPFENKNNYFGIFDNSNSQLVFRVEADAGNYALNINGDGNVGLSVVNPRTDLHMSSPDTPTIRLEQLSTGGFPAQSWDIAANESYFMLRDTARSKIPLFIGTNAPNSALHVASDTGYVGLGLEATAALHVRRHDGTTQLLVEEASAITVNNRILMTLANNGASQFALVDTNSNTDWRFQNFEDKFRVNKAGTGVTEMALDAAGNLTILGALTQNSDRNAKMAIEPVDPAAILTKVAALPVAEWSYTDTAGVRHIGPMAQDFHALFGTGADDTGISTLDTSGVALAAIQALAAENAALRAEYAAFRADVAKRFAELEDAGRRTEGQ